MNKKAVIIAILAATLLWMFTIDALALVQLPEDFRPENLNSFGEIDGTADLSEEELAANPERGSTQTLILFVGKIMNQVLLFAAAVSMIFLFIAGVNYILAFGKDERIERGKRGVFWSVMGLLTVLFSYAIVQAVIKIVLLVDFSAN